ncbi:unnamed protein product [Phytophthora lilii]|uniref:Unnamed protein product n=1 Tax=Phytophthora lilii TaxID=2077276 RepID=A0A9W6WH45_9STRA|nr:unnamed protein product [Phytophthora lilii]
MSWATTPWSARRTPLTTTTSITNRHYWVLTFATGKTELCDCDSNSGSSNQDSEMQNRDKSVETFMPGTVTPNTNKNSEMLTVTAKLLPPVTKRPQKTL